MRSSPPVIVMPEKSSVAGVAPSEAGANGGWAFSERERESARSAIRHVRRRFDIDENRTRVALHRLGDALAGGRVDQGQATAPEAGSAKAGAVDARRLG